ncbi:hypothetical protein BGW38_007650, partial [Lunasporangiospora selenospora]
QERSHRLEYHSVSFTTSVRNKAGSVSNFTIHQVDGCTYSCPLCSESFSTKTSCRRHLQNACGTNFDPEEILPPVTLSELSSFPTPPQQTNKTDPLEHDYELGVLSACNKVTDSDDEKCKALFIVDALGLKPFLLQDELGMDCFALSHRTMVNKLALGKVAVSATNLPRKRRLVEEVPQSIPGLESLLGITPYASTLLNRTFVEIDDAMCEWLNEDWYLQPQLQYACAQALAGSIFYNTRSGEAVINNTIEAYGRKRSVDSHRERFGSKKGVISKTSLPPSTMARYKNIWPMTIQGLDGEQLLLGSQSFNALVTSSMRIDTKEPASIGGSTSSFQLRDPRDSAATRIYLDKEAADRALVIAKNKSTSFISVYNKLDQLRQVRSKFHDGSTYRLCRASGFLSQRHTCHPYTVFTLADYDQSKSADGQAASMVFQCIAKSVLSHGSQATLGLDLVATMRAKCSDKGNIGKILDDLINCFSPGQEAAPIIGNAVLNTHLESLAHILSSYISTANKSVISSVQDCFSE